MTLVSFTCFPQNAAGAVAGTSYTSLFQQWGEQLSNAIQSVGLTKTADTGQLDWSTMASGAAPTTTNQTVGYEIFELAGPSGTAASGAPLYLKFVYGSGDSTDQPAIKVSCGTATDGAGNLGGFTHAAVYAAQPAYLNTVTVAGPKAGPVYVASDGSNYLSIALWPIGGSTYYNGTTYHYTGGAICLDRLRDSGGISTLGAFLVVVNTHTLSDGGYFDNAVFDGVGSWAASIAAADVTSVPGIGFTSLVSGAGIGVLPFIPVSPGQGVSGTALGLLAFLGGDIPVGAKFLAEVYGAPHTFVSVHSLLTAPFSVANQGVAVLCE